MPETTTAKRAAKKPPAKPKAPPKSVVDKLIDLHPEVEAALASGDYPDFILSGLARASRGIRGLTDAVRQETVINGEDS